MAWMLIESIVDGTACPSGISIKARNMDAAIADTDSHDVDLLLREALNRLEASFMLHPLKRKQAIKWRHGTKSAKKVL